MDAVILGIDGCADRHITITRATPKEGSDDCEVTFKIKQSHQQCRCAECLHCGKAKSEEQRKVDHELLCRKVVHLQDYT
jgi:hypothetical protein